jgi:hypothetical protein
MKRLVAQKNELRVGDSRAMPVVETTAPFTRKWSTQQRQDVLRIMEAFVQSSK